MTRLVLDASVLAKWFRPEDCTGAEALRDAYSSGKLLVSAPSLLFLEIINAAARRWQWDAEQLRRLADGLEQLGFDVVEPKPRAVARWAVAGLTAYDACYVAAAEELNTFVVTDDELILRMGGRHARSIDQAVGEIAG